MGSINRFAAFSSRVFIAGLGLVIAWLAAGCGSGAPYVASVLVSPSQKSLAVGQTAQFTVLASWSNGEHQIITNSAAWNSSDSSVATVSSAGVVTSVAVGNVTISAVVSGVKGTASLAVSKAVLTAISMTAPTSPVPLGSSSQLHATGTYSDKSVADVTDQVSWSVAQPGVVTVSTAGLAVATSLGTTQVTATLNDLNASAQINVSGAALASIAVRSKSASIPLGDSEQFSAMGAYTDGSTIDLTGTVAWSSSAPGTVSISSAGLAAAKAVGATAISATLRGVTGTGTLTVSSAALVSIAVNAASASLPLGSSEQLTATGTYSDGTTKDLTSSASWTSSSPSIVSVSGPGLVAGVSVGPATISASSETIVGTEVFTVAAAALSSLRIAPVAPVVPLGSTVQLAVIGTLSDGSTQDVTQQVTWNVDTPSIAGISVNGVASGQQIGSTAIEASLNSLQVSDTLTVQPLLAVSWFDTRSSLDSTVRIGNPGLTGQDLCAMIYVFDQDQQMSECCGCLISPDGMITLSLGDNLLSNPLTGTPSTSGTVMLVSANQAASGGCSASSITPAGTIVAWSTHLAQPQSGQVSSAEVPFSASPLSPSLSSSLQAQCGFVQQLGSGQGICGCGGAQY